MITVAMAAARATAERERAAAAAELEAARADLGLAAPADPLAAPPPRHWPAGLPVVAGGTADDEAADLVDPSGRTAIVHFAEAPAAVAITFAATATAGGWVCHAVEGEASPTQRCTREGVLVMATLSASDPSGTDAIVSVPPPAAS